MNYSSKLFIPFYPIVKKLFPKNPQTRSHVIPERPVLSRNGWVVGWLWVASREWPNISPRCVRTTGRLCLARTDAPSVSHSIVLALRVSRTLSDERASGITRRSRRGAQQPTGSVVAELCGEARARGHTLERKIATRRLRRRRRVACSRSSICACGQSQRCSGVALPVSGSGLLSFLCVCAANPDVPSRAPP